MKPIWMLCVASALMALPGHGADWPPIKPEVWAIKEDPAKGIKDAVILEDRTILKNTYVERVLRVRVLSEAGRKALELEAFSPECYDFSGRTVYPDGKTLKFDKRQDFKQEVFEAGDFTQKRTVVIPPGVSGNCVVELRWLESTAEFYGSRTPLPARMGYDALFRFGGEYHTLLETVEVPMPFAWTYIPISGRTQNFEINERSGFRIISAQNLAAIEMPPFSLPVSLDRPVLSMFFQPKQTARAAKESEKDFWDMVGKAIWKDDFESEVKKGRTYEALRGKLFQGISSVDPLVFAGKLLSDLEKEIINVSHLTHEESAKWPKDLKTPESRDLATISDKKIATGRGMTVLLYHLLKDAGFHPKVAYLADRDVRLFRPAMSNPWQASHPVIAMETANKGIVILDPWQRFAAPGLIHPDFQGVQGILFDPKADWAGQPFTVPIQPAAFNQRRFDYALEVGEEENHFKLKAQFSGFPELAERRRFDQDEQIERNRKLKERFEKQIKGASIQKSEVLNADNPTANVTWAVEGQVESVHGRQRQIYPFPGLPYPLNIPDAFPKDRTLPIVMHYLQIQAARCSFKIPKGYKVNPGNPFKESNTFGTVLWSTQIENQGDDQVAVITLKVSVDTMFAAPAAYDELKTFLGWVSEAFKRTLILEKT